ncbi:MAG: [Fe-Fe] hydrogenase large subunit C-terminal domain-containing protein [Christensenellaceae bacterium]
MSRWVHYVQRKYPDLAAAFSSCLSPMRTFGEALKAHFDALGTVKTKVIAVMPCAAGKV